MRLRCWIVVTVAVASVATACSEPVDRATAWDVTPTTIPADAAEPAAGTADAADPAAGTDAPGTAGAEPTQAPTETDPAGGAAPSVTTPVCAALDSYVAGLVADTAPAELASMASAVYEAAAVGGLPSFGVEDGLGSALAALGDGATVETLDDQDYMGLVDGIGTTKFSVTTSDAAWATIEDSCSAVVAGMDTTAWRAALLRCWVAIEPVLVAMPVDLITAAEPDPLVMTRIFRAQHWPEGCFGVFGLAEHIVDPALVDSALGEAVGGFSPDGLDAMELLGQTAEPEFTEIDPAVG